MSLLASIDFETTGLCWYNEALSGSIKVFGEEPIVRTRTFEISEAELFEQLRKDLITLKARDRDVKLLSYNGDKFDFPFVRTRCIINDTPWMFNGFQHQDLFQLVAFKLLTQYEEQPRLGDLDATTIADIAITLCKQKAKTKPQNIKMLQEFEQQLGSKIDLTIFAPDLKPVLKDSKKLDRVYQILGGPELDDEISDMNGSMVPQLWEEYLRTKDPEIPRIIGLYNASDTIQCEYVYSKVIDTCSIRDKTSWRDL